MAGFVINKIDRFINILTLSLIVCGGMIWHIITALTLSSYYGSPWGYVSLFLPGLSEIYLITLQLNENMYNYTLLTACYLSLMALLGLFWFIKNRVRTKLKATIEW